jgi:ABC-type Fe3+/spermidine/putrescine transport system ATPase subunit
MTAAPESGASTAADLVLSDIGKRFGDKQVLDGVSLAVPRGEVLALLGPSGSGKTTLLRIVAGFETADRGAIRVGEERIEALPPARRDFGMVFQHYALFPHLSVGENVAFGLEARNVPKSSVRERVAAALSRVDLAGFESRRISEISGGQQQRVALARALAPEPRVLLLDEPLSNLDPTLRERTRRELATTLRRIGITTLLVTHEQEEAFDLGDRVALLHDGRLAQLGSPRELYRKPATRFVASFIGRSTFLPVTVLESAPAKAAAAGDAVRTTVGGPALAPGATLSLAVGGFGKGEQADLWLRPEMLEVCTAPEATPLFAAQLVAVRFSGPVSYMTLRSSGGHELEAMMAGEVPALGAVVSLCLRQEAKPLLFAPALSAPASEPAR